MNASKLCINNCGNEVAQGSNRTGKFCSRSCSNSYHNRVSPKRQAVPVECSWPNCSELIYRPAKRCDKHKGLRTSRATKHGLFMPENHEITIGYARVATGFVGDAFAKFLRSLARSWAKEAMPHDKCSNCDYSKTTVLAHIKPLKDFTDTDTLRDTYANNLARLCPNCHWEFDNGYLLYVPDAGFEPA